MKSKAVFLSAIFLVSLFGNIPQSQGQRLLLHIWKGGASPGRSRDIRIWLQNANIEIKSVQFDLLFDTRSLIVIGAERYERGEVFSSVDVDSLDSGLSVYLNGSDSVLLSGDGYIAKVSVRVREDIPRGSEHELVLTNILLEDMSGNEIVLADFSRMFIVPEYDFYFEFFPKTYWGGPGNTEVRASVRVTSYVEASSIDFDVLYDTEIFSVNHAKKSWDAGVFSRFDWNFIEGGISVAMRDAAPFFPEIRNGRITFIYFDIASEAPFGIYDLNLDNIVVRDTTGNEVLSIAEKGEFYINWPSMGVGEGRGFPGSSGNLVQVGLINDFNVNAVAFDLLFDKANLSVSDVQRTERTRNVGIFQGGSIENGLRVVMAPFGAIGTGIGPIADIFFDVKKEAPLGEYYLLLSNVDVHSDTYGSARHISLVNGTFHVVLEKGDVNGDGVVSFEDVITTVDIIIGYYEPTVYEFAAADCNDDDKINILDVVCIVNIVLEN
ncbi:MAG: hypothetical protein JSV84_15635 [Gemmatimonadota bacterium]|nr:MAG: hypothetical protein JSV84_15635 [Gemmatimonadota bacterium]